MLLIAVAPVLWAKGAIALIAFAATLPAIRVMVGPLRDLLAGEEDLNTDSLIDQVGVTDVGEVRNDFGRALVRVGTRELVLEVRCREGVITPRGTEVRLVEYVSSGGFFWVEKVHN